MLQICKTVSTSAHPENRKHRARGGAVGAQNKNNAAFVAGNAYTVANFNTFANDVLFVSLSGYLPQICICDGLDYSAVITSGGVPPASIAYQWFTSANGLVWTLQQSGMSNTFTALASCNANTFLYVRVVATDLAGNTATTQSGATWVTDNDMICNRGTVGGVSYEADDDLHLFNLMVFPNPIEHTAKITFTLAADTWVRIEISDNLGRVLTTKRLGELAIGRHQVDIDCSQLPAGLYTLRVYTGVGVTKATSIFITR